MDQRHDLAGRVVIVTGGSSGLGARFVSVLAGAGASVVAAARRLDRLNAIADGQPNVVPIQADLLEDAARTALVADTLDRFGRVDVLVNNAGMSGTTHALDEPLDRVRAVLELNLVAVFDLARLAARAMIEAGGGSIVNVSSMAGSVAAAPFSDAAYCATKAGVNGLTRELAVQWARHGVRVNALAPGYFRSEMTDAIAADEGAMRYVQRNTPMGRMGLEHELDGALLFLASDASAYCTGHVLTVDGGWTAR
jgi:NAD(P)-dependent dehydrogenase (short-subunit alcohol dehydrogenase family)